MIQFGSTHLVVALLESLLRETFPALRSIDGLRSLESDVEVTALNGEVEPGIFVLHKVKGNLA